MRFVKSTTVRSIIWSSMAVLLNMTFIGCGAGGPKIATVQGTVTLDGHPLPYAAVVFTPENGRPGGATTDDNGKFALSFTEGRQGALLGTHRVIITTRRHAWKDKQGNVQPGSGERLPSKYNTETTLTFTVEAGKTNIANFNLESSENLAQTSQGNGTTK